MLVLPLFIAKSFLRLEQRLWKNPHHSKMVVAIGIGVILSLDGAKQKYNSSVHPEGFWNSVSYCCNMAKTVNFSLAQVKFGNILNQLSSLQDSFLLQALTLHCFFSSSPQQYRKFLSTWWMYSYHWQWCWRIGGGEGIYNFCLYPDGQGQQCDALCSMSQLLPWLCQVSVWPSARCSGWPL